MVFSPDRLPYYIWPGEYVNGEKIKKAKKYFEKHNNSKIKSFYGQKAPMER